MTKVAFITGAARGIGAEASRRLAGEGYRVALVGLEPSELERVSGQCPGSIWIEADVTDRVALRAAVDRTVEELGGIDVCIANAGIAAAGFLEHMDEDVFERVFEVNLVGAYRTVQYCLPHVIERRGYVLGVASFAAIAHAPAFSVYCATKAGVEAFADVLRGEVSHLGVAVGVAYFSWIDTEMVRGADRSDIWGPFRAQLRGPLGKTAPLSDAGDVILAGVLGRHRIVSAPRWVRYLSPIRRPLQKIVEIGAKREVPDIYAKAKAAVAERGADVVTRVVGAGGEADSDALQARSSNHTLVEPS
jgi:NAD(P)-dependent dehydrogenase (short-subunit alcohol dehydrogenase family)